MTLYLEHFGLKEAPFPISPNPRFLFMSRQHREALAHLRHGLSAGGGVIVLTGEVGAGKTTLSRRLIEELPERIDVAWIINPKLDARELLLAICTELGIETDAAGAHHIGECISRALLERHAAGRDTLLMIDEAQHLSREALEQVRLLTNLETNDRKLLQILLIGQPELRDTLNRHDMRQLEQRIVARFHIAPLSRHDTARMIAHRWQVAGGDDPPFTPAALRRLHRESGGIPRRINLIADRALLGAYAGNRSRVDAALVRRAAREIRGEAPRRAALPRLGLIGALAASGLIAAFIALTGPNTPPRAAPDAPPATPTLPTATEPAAPHPMPPAPWDAIAQDGTHAQALTTLARLWTPNPPPLADCNALAPLRLGCLTLEADLARLRDFDRPALLRIAGRRSTGQVALIRLDADRAELRLGDRTWVVPVRELELHREARVTLLWRTPPGWREPIRPGDRGPMPRWLNRQLDRVIGELIPPAGEIMDRRAVARLREFQRREGLQPDGAAGPLTLMRLNDALGLPRPHLRRDRPGAR